jgi:predicted HTH transcriptional regulator
VTSEQLRTAIALGREQRNTEFKGPGARSDKPFLAKVVRAVLAMANRSDGGVVVIGVDDDGESLTPTGLTQTQVATWRYDDLQSSVTNYADPAVDMDVNVVSLDGHEFIAITVSGFSELPILCKKDYSGILRNGALYVRRYGKNESVEIPSHIEMREVIERAAELVARKMVRTATRLQPYLEPSASGSARQKFDREVEDLL